MITKKMKIAVCLLSLTALLSVNNMHAGIFRAGRLVFKPATFVAGGVAGVLAYPWLHKYFFISPAERASLLEQQAQQEENTQANLEDEQNLTQGWIGKLVQVAGNIKDNSVLYWGNCVDIPDINGRTPLLCAAKKGYQNLVEFLVESGANIDAQDKLGRTALIEVVSNRKNKFYDNIITYLVKKGVDISKRTRIGETALNIAIKADDEKIATYLRCHLIEKIYKQNTEECLICLEQPQTIGKNNCTLMPCCNNFICEPDFKEIVLPSKECPVCRAKLTVAHTQN
ncbi:hypothetical protein E3J79_03790 [Candidatus Dependentiae bacterium]|nr:MAG: hypothetical protein E3J79_03790 [Candidatus Dependentiae bacterium]